MRAGAEVITEARATALGALAVLLWSALALLTVGAKRLPPFQLLSGIAQPTWRLGAAALLVAGGAALASLPRR